MAGVVQWVQAHPEATAAIVSVVLAVVSLFIPGVSTVVARLIAMFLQYNGQLQRVIKELPKTPDKHDRVIQQKTGALVRNLAKTPAGKKAIQKVAKSMDIDVRF